MIRVLPKRCPLVLTRSALWLLACGVFVFLSCEDATDVDLSSNDLAVTRIEPISALSGDTIQLFGSGFNPDPIRNLIQFQSSQVTARVTSATGEQLNVVVPEDAQIGPLQIAVGPFSTISSVPFQLSPTLTAVTPNVGFPGEKISLRGQNLSSDLSRLVVFFGAVEVDSIIGASFSQIDLVIPAEIESGPVEIFAGILVQGDTVYTPGLDFTVLDPDRPLLLSMSPATGFGGATVEIFGSRFKTDRDSISVDFGGEILRDADLVELEETRIVVNVPTEIDVEGLGSLEVNVSVTVIADDGEALTTDPLTFTVLERLALPVFYYVGLNDPDQQVRIDDSLYVAEPTIDGGVINALNLSTNPNIGVTLDPGNDKIYFTTIFEIFEGDLQTMTSSAVRDEVTGDIALNRANQQAYVYSGETEIREINLGDGASEALLRGQRSFTRNGVVNMKYRDGMVYFCGELSGLNVIKSLDVTNPADNTLYSNDHNDNPSDKYVALAVGESDLYVVKAAHFPVQPKIGGSGSNSVILSGPKDGSAPLQAIYDQGDGIGDHITDLELSSDGQTLYWIVKEEEGSIRSAPVSRDPSQVQVLVSGIRNGIYFDLIEPD